MRFLANWLTITDPDTDPANTYYSPGTIGFILTLMVALGAIGLIWDMVRRVRRVRYRAEIQEKLDREAAEAEASAAKASAKRAKTNK
jgi:hypothetical protein